MTRALDNMSTAVVKTSLVSFRTLVVTGGPGKDTLNPKLNNAVTSLSRWVTPTRMLATGLPDLDKSP